MSKKYSYQDYLDHKPIKLNNNKSKFIDVPDEKEKDLIIHNLWLGDYRAAYNKPELDKHNIQIIINATDILECPFSDKVYYLIPFHDKDVCDDCNKNFIINSIISSIMIIDYALDHDIGVLVHCKKGHHRSANIILFYLMYKFNLGYLPSVFYINNIRPGALNRVTCINKWGIEFIKSYFDFLLKHKNSDLSHYISSNHIKFDTEVFYGSGKYDI